MFMRRSSCNVLQTRRARDANVGQRVQIHGTNPRSLASPQGFGDEMIRVHRWMEVILEQEALQVRTNLVAFFAALQHPSQRPSATTCARYVGKTLQHETRMAHSYISYRRLCFAHATHIHATGSTCEFARILCNMSVTTFAMNLILSI